MKLHEPSRGTMIHRRVGSGLAGHADTLAVVAVMGLLTLLVSPDLMPSYAQINAYDEARYIESGHLMLAGEFRNIVWGPLVALVYAPLHLIVGDSPDWFIIEAGLGRIIMFLALLSSTYYLALQLKNAIGRYYLLGVLFISSAYLEVLENPSDALFVVFSALMLAKVIAFQKSGRAVDIAAASAFLGLAVLCRFEALVLIVALLLATGLTHTSWATRYRSVLASVVPVTLVLGVYLLAFRLTSPGADPGIGSKAYAAFEVSQSILTTGTQADRAEYARSLFGTREDNRGSILVAIGGNPLAFGRRLLTNAGRTPDRYLEVFGRRVGFAILAFAIVGAYSLLRTRKFRLLITLACWGLVPLVGLAFLPFHIMRHASGLIHIMSSVGITSALGGVRPNVERRVTWLAAVLLAAYGLADGKLALLVVGVVLAGAFLLMALGAVAAEANPAVGLRGPMLLLAAGLILHGSYPFPDYSPIGTSTEEAVVHYLQSEFPPGALILESLPLPAIAAKMTDVPWSAAPEGLAAPVELHGWLESEGIQVVLVDEMDAPRPDLVALLEAELGSQFEIGHRSEGGRYRVFVLRPALKSP
jgi:hypothetical protein